MRVKKKKKLDVIEKPLNAESCSLLACLKDVTCLSWTRTVELEMFEFITSRSPGFYFHTQLFCVNIVISVVQRREIKCVGVMFYVEQ